MTTASPTTRARSTSGNRILFSRARRATSDGSLTRPPYGDAHPGVVVIHGTACADRGLVQSFTRSLSMFNLATLSFTPRGCSGDDAQPTSEADLIEDAVAARAHMAGSEPARCRPGWPLG